MTNPQPVPFGGRAPRHVLVSEAAFLAQVCNYLPHDFTEPGALAPWGIDVWEVDRLNDGTRLAGLDGDPPHRIGWGADMLVCWCTDGQHADTHRLGNQ